VALVGTALLVILFAQRGTDSAASLASALPADDPLAPPPRSGLAVPEPQPLALRGDGVSLWAPVLRTLLVREAPSASARVLARVTAATPERTQNIFLIRGRTQRNDGLWVPVRIAGGRGWAPRMALGGYEAVDTRLLVDTGALRATLLRANRVVFRAVIGVGTADAPTPTGSFFVRNLLTRYRSAFYGPVAFGTSARSTLTDWPAGGFVGIHGTNHPELLPGRVSHGCIRMRNDDIVTLARLMPVGTPVEIT
jgi:L,D-transpeptidase catalytic domain